MQTCRRSINYVVDATRMDPLRALLTIIMPGQFVLIMCLRLEWPGGLRKKKHLLLAIVKYLKLTLYGWIILESAQISARLAVVWHWVWGRLWHLNNCLNEQQSGCLTIGWIFGKSEILVILQSDSPPAVKRSVVNCRELVLILLEQYDCTAQWLKWNWACSRMRGSIFFFFFLL